MKVDIHVNTPCNPRKKLEESEQSIISSRNGPVKSTEARGRQKHGRRVPHYETTMEENDKGPTQHLMHGTADVG